MENTFNVNSKQLEEFEGEVFKEFPLNSDYLISNFSRIKSKKRLVIRKNKGRTIKEEMILSQYINQKGYYSSGINIDNKSKNVSVHRLVALTFISNPENKPQVNHINAVKTDNRIENLEWATSKENVTHALKMGLLRPRKGDNHPFYKLAPSKTTTAKPVVNTLTGEEFGSIKEAAISIGMAFPNLAGRLSGRIKNDCNMAYKPTTL